MLTSKGASGVTGAGFITLAATLTAIPTSRAGRGMTLVLGIDKFMSECRALTNLVGNGVATHRRQPLGGRARPRETGGGPSHRRVDPSNVETAVTTG